MADVCSEFVQNACEGKPKKEVEQLNLEGQNLQNQLNELAGFDSLKSLQLSNCSLTSMEKFPEFPALTELDLMKNEIKGSLSFLNKCQSLVKLDLSDNKIENIMDLEPLKNLKNLTSIKLINNSVVNSEGFADKVHKLLPQVMTLQTTEEGDDDDESGSEAGSDVSMSLQDLVEKTLEDDSDDGDFEGGEEGSEEDEDISEGEDEDELNAQVDTSVKDEHYEQEEKALKGYKRKADDNGDATEEPAEKK